MWHMYIYKVAAPYYIEIGLQEQVYQQKKTLKL